MPLQTTCESDSAPSDSDLRGHSVIHPEFPMDEPEFREIAVDFLETLTEKLALMEQLIQQSNHAELAKQAHWLKGAGGTCGFSKFSQPALALELSAKGEKAEEYYQRMQAIHDIRDRIVIPEPENCI